LYLSKYFLYILIKFYYIFLNYILKKNIKLKILIKKYIKITIYI